MVAEEADVVECLGDRYGFEPFDADEIFAALGVCCVIAVVFAAGENLQRGARHTIDFEGELGGRLCRLEDFTDADVSGAGDADPDAVAGLEDWERAAVPCASAGRDESVFDGFVP